MQPQPTTTTTTTNTFICYKDISFEDALGVIRGSQFCTTESDVLLLSIASDTQHTNNRVKSSLVLKKREGRKRKRPKRRKLDDLVKQRYSETEEQEHEGEDDYYAVDMLGFRNVFKVEVFNLTSSFQASLFNALNEFKSPRLHYFVMRNSDFNHSVQLKYSLFKQLVQFLSGGGGGGGGVGLQTAQLLKCYLLFCDLTA